MLKINSVLPGQRVTVRYSSPVNWQRTTDNPFIDLQVTRSMEVAFTAAGAETYERQLDKRGAEKSGKPSWHRPAPEIGPCVRVHKGNGTPYLASINNDTVSSVFLIGGIPATEEESNQIRSFLRASRETERGLDFRLWTLDKLSNATIG